MQFPTIWMAVYPKVGLIGWSLSLKAENIASMPTHITTVAPMN